MAGKWVIEVTDRDFDQSVIERSKQTPVVLDFWATWCQPCRVLSPLLEKLADEYAGQFVLAKCDVDQNQGLAAEFQVSGIPMVFGIVEGAVKNYFTGAASETQIRQFLSQLIPTGPAKLLKDALAKETTDTAGARALLEEVIATEPANSVALAALADLLWAAGEIDRAAELARKVGEGTDGHARAKNVLARLEFRDAAQSFGSIADCQAKVDAEPSDLTARVHLGLALAAAGQFADALETLVQVAERDPSFGGEHARPAMVKIFNIVGQQSDLANTFRSRLSRALY